MVICVVFGIYGYHKGVSGWNECPGVPLVMNVVCVVFVVRTDVWIVSMVCG